MATLQMSVQWTILPDIDKTKHDGSVDGDLVKIAEHKSLFTAERLSKLQGQRNFWIEWMI